MYIPMLMGVYLLILRMNSCQRTSHHHFCYNSRTMIQETPCVCFNPTAFNQTVTQDLAQQSDAFSYCYARFPQGRFRLNTLKIFFRGSIFFLAVPVSYDKGIQVILFPPLRMGQSTGSQGESFNKTDNPWVFSTFRLPKRPEYWESVAENMTLTNYQNCLSLTFRSRVILIRVGNTVILATHMFHQ